MNKTQNRNKLKLKREKFRKSLPQINLKTCRVEKSKDSKALHFIIEGDPVVLGAVLPKIDIGEQAPLKMMASLDGKIAVGLVKGYPKNPRVLIDYGFTKGSCKIEETDFSRKDAYAYKRITQLPVRMACRDKVLRKVRKYLARIFLFLKNKN